MRGLSKSPPVWGLPALLVGLALLSGCSAAVPTLGTSPATLAAPSANHLDLISLPPPKGTVRAAVYSFRDQTGQYKPQEGVTSFSTAVTQGGTSILVQALKDSHWFVPIEREGLQNILTERKILRASLKNNGQDDIHVPTLETAQVLFEGGVIAYDTNLVTGGFGAKYFGAGGSVEYRMDQVWIYLRAVDVRTGRILKSTSTTKTILSREVDAGIFRYVSYKRLLEVETGLTTNEPTQLAVVGAIEKAVSSLIVEGIVDGLWELKNPGDIKSPIIQNYLKDRGLHITRMSGR